MTQFSASLKSFMTAGKSSFYSKSEVIYTSDAEQASVFMIRKGFVKSYTITSDGDYNTLSFYGPDAIFPLGPVLRSSDEDSAFFGIRSQVYFEAMTDVELCIRPLSDFMATLRNHPDYYRELTYRLLQNYEIFLARAESLQYRFAKHRVAYLILVLTDIYGRRNGGKGKLRLDLPLTHQEIANTLSLARETVSRAMEELKTDDLIETPDRHIIVKHTRRLRELLE